LGGASFINSAFGVVRMRRARDSKRWISLIKTAGAARGVCLYTAPCRR
jgi:hypothetical protein